MIIVRIIALLALAVGVVFALKKVLDPPSEIKCNRCNGKGFWLGARGREKCDRCNGTGKIPRQKGAF